MPNSRTFLNDNFLIAMPTLKTPSFKQAVMYICEHNETGAMGLIINHPSSMFVSELFMSMRINAHASLLNAQPILWGGPLEKERGFIIHRPGPQQWQASLQLSDDIMVTSSRDILEAMAVNEGPAAPLIVLGYAGWEKGQLEQEIVDNCWLHIPAEAHIMFEAPFEQRWHAAIAALGLNENHILAMYTGHA